MSKPLDEAYRERAGMIGALASCVCCYPLTTYDTASGHDERCQAHAVILFQRTQQAAARGLEPIAMASPFSTARRGDGWWARCRACGGEFIADSVPELAAVMATSHRHLPEVPK